MDESSTARHVDLNGLTPSEQRALLRTRSAGQETQESLVAETIAIVRDEGDDGLCRLASERSDADLDPCDLQIDDGDFVHAYERLDPEETRRLEETVDRIRDFHEAEMPQELWLTQVRPGQWAGHRFRPIDAVACYVPNGSDKRSESAVLSTIPALIADVPRVVIVTPPNADGSVSDLILVASATVGVGEIYKLELVPAAAALAFGTQRVPSVDKLMAPHGPALVQAGRLLTDDLQIQMIDGQGGHALLVDVHAEVDRVHAKLVSMSDMVVDKPLFVVSSSAELLNSLGKKWTGKCMCDLVLAPSMSAAIDFINLTDPDVLTVFTVDPVAILPAIQTTGRIEFVGSMHLAADSNIASSNAYPCRSALSVFDFLERSALSYGTADLATMTGANAAGSIGPSERASPDRNGSGAC